jgi:hypothetical protein
MARCDPFTPIGGWHDNRILLCPVAAPQSAPVLREFAPLLDAAEELQSADYCARVGLTGTARFAYRGICREYWGTPFRTRAEQRLRSLGDPAYLGESHSLLFGVGVNETLRPSPAPPTSTPQINGLVQEDYLKEEAELPTSSLLDGPCVRFPEAPQAVLLNSPFGPSDDLLGRPRLLSPCGTDDETGPPPFREAVADLQSAEAHQRAGRFRTADFCGKLVCDRYCGTWVADLSQRWLRRLGIDTHPGEPSFFDMDGSIVIPIWMLHMAERRGLASELTRKPLDPWDLGLPADLRADSRPSRVALNRLSQAALAFQEAEFLEADSSALEVVPAPVGGEAASQLLRNMEQR